MSGKPRKNKKYNKQKALQMKINSELKKHFLCFAAKCNPEAIMCDRAGNIVDITLEAAYLLENTKQKWSVVMYVMLRSNNNENYLQSERIDMIKPYHRDEILDFLSDKHKELVKTCNNNHIVNGGWICSIDGIEPKDELAMDIFERMGAYDFKAQWQ